MRKRLLTEGAKELSYEIREIVKKANQLKALGLKIHWENIGDPIEKHCQVPEWIKEIVGEIVEENKSYGYCPSKGLLATREFLASETNKLGGVQITADDILFFNGLGDAISTIYSLLSITCSDDFVFSRQQMLHHQQQLHIILDNKYSICIIIS